MSSVNEIISASSTITTNQSGALTNKEKSAIYALRALSESSKEKDNIIGFLVASDHLVGNKSILLSKARGDDVLTKYTNRIFEVRDIYLGIENAKVKDLDPLFYAILTKDEQQFSQILQSIASAKIIEEFSKTFSPANQPDIKISHIECLLKVNSSSLVKLFIQKLSQPDLKEFLNAKDSNGRNKLSSAASKGHNETVKAFLESKAITQNPELFKKFLNAKSTIPGYNALSAAASNGHTEVVKAFLESEVITQNPELFEEFLNAKDNNGLNALSFAAEKGHTKAVKVLLEKGVRTDYIFFPKFLLSAQWQIIQEAQDNALDPVDIQISTINLPLKKGIHVNQIQIEQRSVE